jgi:uncharacterized membrane protein YfcA
LVAGCATTLLRGIALNYKKVMVALWGAMASGFVMAHGASYDHTHTLIESPAVLLCLVAVVGVIASISKSAKQTPRPIPIEIDQRHKRTSEESR